MPRAELRRGFSLLEMLYWLAYGSFTTYTVSFLTATRGASASQAGLMLAIFMASACLGQFFVNGLCDRHQNNRRVFMGGMLTTIVLQLGIYFSPSMLLLGVGYAALGFIQPAIGAVLDTWLIRSFPDDPNAFSPIRALGSLSYSALMVVMGFSLEWIGHVTMPVLSTVFALAGTFVASRMPEIPALSAPVRRESAQSRLKALPMIVWLFVLSMGVMGTANMPLINMNLLILESVGGTVASTGIATAFNTVGEFIAMRYPRLLGRFSARQKIMLAGALYLGSTLLMLAAGSVRMIFLASFINGLAYGVMLPARRQMVNETAPENMLNRVHGMGDMAYSNFGGLVGNQMSGLLIDLKGVRLMLAVSVAIQALGLLIIATFKRAMRQPAKGNDAGIS